MRRSPPTLTHDWIWQAIDAIAARRHLSPSALARLAGLDPTAFNRSKRFTQEGRPRWPSTESIAKVLEATGTSLDEFAEIESGGATDTRAPGLIGDPDAPHLANVPLVGEVRDAEIAELEPLPVSPRRVRSRRRALAPALAPLHRFAIAVGDSSLEPVYSQGNTLIVSPSETPRPGDRVVVKPKGLPAVPRILLKAGRTRIELATFRPEPCRLRLERQAIDWMARIIWVRQ